MKRACIFPAWIVMMCLASCGPVAATTSVASPGALSPAVPTPAPQTTPSLGVTPANAGLTPRPNSPIDPTLSARSRPTASPEIATISTALSPAGWQTFVSARWHVAVAYAPTWSVDERPEGVSFNSPPDGLVQLAPVATGALSPEEYLSQEDLPNMRCSTSANASGLAVRVCFDSVAGSHTAEFIMTSPGGQQDLLTLAMAKRGDLPVFNAMVASLRAVP